MTLSKREIDEAWFNTDEILLLQSVVKSAKANFDPDGPWILLLRERRRVLVQLKASDVRTYAKTSQVVQSYLEKGLTPQWSIGRIHKLGLQSGLCLR